MRIVFAAVAALGLMLAMTPTAEAGHRGHGVHGGSVFKGHFGKHRRHGRFRHGRHRHRRGYSSGAIVVGAILGGLVIGHLLTRPYPRDYASQRTARVGPVPAAPPAGLGDCKPTTGTQRTASGRTALMAGTWCTDAAGRGFIVNDSVRFIGYLD